LERGAEVGTREEVVVGAFEGVLEEVPCAMCLGDAGVQLGDLAFGERAGDAGFSGCGSKR
jgi:hypothetical protein